MRSSYNKIQAKKEKLDRYIERCFRDAFESENKQYSEDAYDAQYILISDADGLYYFYPMFTCKYYKVRRKVLYRIEHNIEKNFCILFGSVSPRYAFYCCLDSSSIINRTRAAIRNKETGKLITISIYDEKDPLYKKEGDYISSYVSEKLLIKYYDLKPDEYYKLNDDNYIFPIKLRYDWRGFKELWESTFEKDICPYDIILSDGLERL